MTCFPEISVLSLFILACLQLLWQVVWHCDQGYRGHGLQHPQGRCEHGQETEGTSSGTALLSLTCWYSALILILHWFLTPASSFTDWDWFVAWQQSGDFRESGELFCSAHWWVFTSHTHTHTHTHTAHSLKYFLQSFYWTQCWGPHQELVFHRWGFSKPLACSRWYFKIRPVISSSCGNVYLSISDATPHWLTHSVWG